MLISKRLVLLGAVVTTLFGLSFYLVSPSFPPEHAVACEYRNFDYPKLLAIAGEMARSSQARGLSIAVADGLQGAERRYFLQKARSLNSLVEFVELYVEKHGSGFGCSNPGYHLLLSDLDYPTFRGIQQDSWIERLRTDKERQTNPLKDWTLVLLSPLIAVIAIGLDLLKSERRLAHERELNRERGDS